MARKLIAILFALGMVGLVSSALPTRGPTRPGGVRLISRGAQSQPGLAARRTQVRFTRPSGMKVRWYVRTADGKDSYSEPPIEAPGRYNFRQAAIYRLKLSDIAGRPGLDVYPSLEVVPSRPETQEFLSHSAVPVAFTDDEFKQVVAGNFVVKVIYLPRPENQTVSPGPEEIVSTQLEPGTDPVQEALRRGYILLVIRMGNADLETPNGPGGK